MGKDIRAEAIALLDQIDYAIENADGPLIALDQMDNAEVIDIKLDPDATTSSAIDISDPRNYEAWILPLEWRNVDPNDKTTWPTYQKRQGFLRRFFDWLLTPKWM